jgi:hypothetical protein
MVFRAIQVLLERAPGDPEGLAHVLRRHVPWKLVVAGLVRSEQRAGLLFREVREEERRREAAPGSGGTRGPSFRDEARVRELLQEGPRVHPVFEDQGDERLPFLPSDRRHDVRVLVRQGGDCLVLVSASVEQERVFTAGPGMVEDRAA